MRRVADDLGAEPYSDDAELAEELAAARERGDHGTVARIEHCFAVSRQVNPTNDRRGSKTWQRAVALGHQPPKIVPPLPRVRTARPRGAGRPRAQASRSGARSGDSGDSESGSTEGGEPPGLAALLNLPRTCFLLKFWATSGGWR
ncbi:MAG: hypothetical protein ACR2NH_12840 [Solirubrobacteraceae bacterium]